MEEENKQINETPIAETEAPAEAVTEEPVANEATPEEVVSEAPAAETQAEEEASSQKKPISKAKRILNFVVLGVQILFVLAAITICLVMILNPKAPDEISPLGVKLLSVQSNSMAGDGKDNFKKGDLIIAKNPKNNGLDLPRGTIVTFKALDKQSGLFFLDTHRIIDSFEQNGQQFYITKGDNTGEDEVDDAIHAENVLAVYSFHIKGLGRAIDWIRDGYHFIYVVIIPLGLLLIYNIYLVAQIVIEAKMKKAKAVAAETARSSLSEEDLLRMLKERGIDPSALQGQEENKDNTGSDQ